MKDDGGGQQQMFRSLDGGPANDSSAAQRPAGAWLKGMEKYGHSSHHYLCGTFCPYAPNASAIRKNGFGHNVEVVFKW